MSSPIRVQVRAARTRIKTVEGKAVVVLTALTLGTAVKTVEAF